MPQVSEVQVTVARKVSKDYNVSEFRYGVTVQLSEGDDPEAIMADWTQHLKDQIKRETTRPSNGQ